MEVTDSKGQGIKGTVPMIREEGFWRMELDVSYGKRNPDIQYTCKAACYHRYKSLLPAPANVG